MSALAHTWLAAAAIVLALCPLVAVAQTPPPVTEESLEQRLAKPNYARGGYFLAVEGLAAVENSPVIAPNSYLVSGGFDIRIGNRHNRWFASELYGLYVHQYGDGTGRFLAWGMSANGRFYFTRSRVQPFVTVGAGFLQLETRGAVVVPGLPFVVTEFDPKFAMLFGTGVEFFVNQDFALNLMANYHLPFAGETNDFGFVTAGLGFVFF